MLNRITDNIFYTPNSAETDRPNLGYVRGTEAAITAHVGQLTTLCPAVFSAWYSSHTEHPTQISVIPAMHQLGSHSIVISRRLSSTPVITLCFILRLSPFIFFPRTGGPSARRPPGPGRNRGP